MFLDDFQNPLSLFDVVEFLRRENKSFKEISKTNDCRKWSKWIACNERPFPCVCPTRNEDCIFAEVYYELDKVSKISNFEKECEEAILDFYSIKEDDDILLLDWLKQYENLHSKVYKFKDTIIIAKCNDPYEKLIIKISYSAIIEDFKQIYTKVEMNV